MSVWHYEDNPLPVGAPVKANGSDTWYQLGLYDGATHADQYADEPEETILFQTPEAAEEWLEAVTVILTPYIERNNRERRVPNADGWAE